MSGGAIKTKPRVFSGAQPTGNMHLGNYLGAFRNWARLQADYECLYCVVDLHALTVYQEPKTFRAQVREAAAAYLASGVDPAKSLIFCQSAVPGHAGLAWIFACIARVGWLNRMTQFKDKAGKDKEKASVGLYVYPTLMAADILLYLATHVPVGEDQKQHLELTRDIAQKFNNDYGVEFFPLVEPVILKDGGRVMSLRDGRQKMSKSDPSDYSRINLSDDADAIALKIKKARTDADAIPSAPEGLKNRPEAENLISIYASLTGETPAAVCRTFGGKGFAEFKGALAELAVAKLAPVTAEMARLKSDPGHVDKVLATGAEKANALAEPVLAEVHRIVGLTGR
jgi:tryptophanyl-tRNA synthetase